MVQDSLSWTDRNDFGSGVDTVAISPGVPLVSSWASDTGSIRLIVECAQADVSARFNRKILPRSSTSSLAKRYKLGPVRHTGDQK